MHFPILDLKDGRRAPLRLSTRLLNAIMRLATVAPLGRIPQQDVAVLGEDLIVGNDVQISHARHDLGVRLGVVHRGLAVREGRRRPEPAVGSAKVGDGFGAFVVFGGVGDGHVGFDDSDVFLQWGISLLLGIVGTVESYLFFWGLLRAHASGGSVGGGHDDKLVMMTFGLKLCVS